MQLSLSVRIAEAPTKDRMTMPLERFAELAQRTGYAAVCIRASAGGVQTPLEELRKMRSLLDRLGLFVSMATTDVDVPLNNDRGPNNLCDIGPHLDVAEALGAKLVRVCLKVEADIPAAQRAADQARERGIRLAHQCHHDTLFETIDSCVETVRRVGRENFGLIYEPGNLYLCGEPYTGDAIRRLAPHVFNVYVQNHRLDPAGPERSPTRTRGEAVYFNLPLWESGGIDFVAVFAGLKEIGYNGTVTVHQEYAKLMGPVEAAEESFRYLNSLIHKSA